MSGVYVNDQTNSLLGVKMNTQEQPVCKHGTRGECDQCNTEIMEGMLVGWQSGSLTTRTLDRILVDALADAWQDTYRPGRSVHERRTEFRIRLARLVDHATGEGPEWIF